MTGVVAPTSTTGLVGPLGVTAVLLMVLAGWRHGPR
jgi:hypothetical protein